MDKVCVIRHKVMVEGKSVRSVSREMGISRNTVAKYLGVSEPVRRETVLRPQPVLEKVVARIDEIQAEWAHRVTPKQRLTGSRIHRQLVEERYQVGITTIRDYLREKRRREAEVYIPLVHRPGEEAQCDFFDVTVEEKGKLRQAWKLVLRLPYSGRDFVRLYDSCDQLSFLDGHVRAAAHFGGLPRRIVYDNLSSAVKRKVGLERQLTERFRALVSHYLFEPCFTRRGEGHDKGSVESRGKGIRLQHLTPVPRGDSLARMSQALLLEVEAAWLDKVTDDGRRCADLWEEESGKLPALPPWPFEARQVVLVPVSSKSTVRIEGVTYSVPSGWARLEATAYVGVEDIRLVCRDETELVPRQRRGGKHIQYRHYLPELARKPQAVRQVAPELVAQMGQPYGRLWSLLESRYGSGEAARVLCRVLGAVVDHGSPAVAGALEAAFQSGRCDLMALSSHLQEDPLMVEVPMALQGYRIESASPEELRCPAGRWCAMSEAAVREAVIREHLGVLKLPGVAREYTALARQARDGGWAYEEFLQQVLEAELRSRQERATVSRIREAHFPDIKTLDQLDWKALQGVSRPKLLELASCDYLSRAEDVILAGPIGTGKTHIAIALGVEAARRRFHVGFSRAADLVRTLLEARDERLLGQLHRRLEKVDLLIVDELGFVPFDRAGGELLFNLLSKLLWDTQNRPPVDRSKPATEAGGIWHTSSRDRWRCRWETTLGWLTDRGFWRYWSLAGATVA